MRKLREFARVPSAGTPPGTPPPWNPREASSTGRTGRVQEAVQRFEAPQTSNVPAPEWHGWKTQTGPTIADMEQSRMSPFGEQESEMADPDLREAMIRSLHDMTRDPHEPPVTGGASGSGVAARHHPSPQQASTPIPRIGAGVASPPSAQLQSDDITSADICLMLEDRIKKQKLRIAELIDKMGSIDRDFTEADFAELNDLKQSVAGCRRSLEQARQEQQVTEIPRPPVQLPSNDPPASEDPTPAERRKSRSRPRSIRGRSKRDRRHPDSGDRRPSRRRKGEPIVVTPEVTIPRPTMAAIFQAGAEDLSSSCPTSQEPTQSVPHLFQMGQHCLWVGRHKLFHHVVTPLISRALQGIQDHKVKEGGLAYKLLQQMHRRHRITQACSDWGHSVTTIVRGRPIWVDPPTVQAATTKRMESPICGGEHPEV